MKISWSTYIREFWSPVKIAVLLALAAFIVIYFYQGEFYRNVCFSESGLQNSPCSQLFLNAVYVPFATNALLLVAFTLLLLIIPLQHLQRWFKVVGSWLIPLGLLVYVTNFSDSQASGGFGPNPAAVFGVTTVLFYVVLIWISSIIIFLVTKAARGRWLG
jgi:hypothetical protein